MSDNLQDFYQIYPSAVRANQTANDNYSGYSLLFSRRQSEENIVNIINCLSDTKSFVITKTLPEAYSDLVEFCVGGYYFAIKKENLIAKIQSDDDEYLTVTIRLSSHASSLPIIDDYSELTSVECPHFDAKYNDAGATAIIQGPVKPSLPNTSFPSCMLYFPVTSLSRRNPAIVRGIVMPRKS